MMSKELRRVVESAVLKVFMETLPNEIEVVVTNEELECWGYDGLLKYVLGKITKEVNTICNDGINGYLFDEYLNNGEYVCNEVDKILKNWLYAKVFNVNFELTLVED